MKEDKVYKILSNFSDNLEELDNTSAHVNLAVWKKQYDAVFDKVRNALADWILKDSNYDSFFSVAAKQISDDMRGTE